MRRSTPDQHRNYSVLRRALWLVLTIVAGAWFGGKLGTVLSYWFAPPIMRMYLSWTDYLARLPEQLYPGDPIGLLRTVSACYLIGTIVGALLGLILYRCLNRRK